MTKVSYGAAAEEVIQLFDQYFIGSSNRPFLVICFDRLGESAHNALERSLDSLGYEAPAFSLATISPVDAPAPLDPSALRLLVESVDPYRIICADECTIHSIEEAYAITLSPNAIGRIQGRSSGIFLDLDEMVQDSRKKYIAWEILKALK